MRAGEEERGNEEGRRREGMRRGSEVVGLGETFL